jgi:type IV secretory pathway VirB2 component (pilin)
VSARITRRMIGAKYWKFEAVLSTAILASAGSMPKARQTSGRLPATPLSSLASSVTGPISNTAVRPMSISASW